MKSFLLGILFLIGVTFTARAQRVCGTVIYRQQLMNTDPSLKQTFRNIEGQVAAATQRANANMALRDTAANEIIQIPVVIHLLYKNSAQNISDAQIKSQIDVLNQDYNLQNADRANTPQAFKPVAGDARIQFSLAQVDPKGKTTSGIDRRTTTLDFFTTDDGMKMAARGGAAAWDCTRYLNIWVCNLSGSSLGYAAPPGSPANVDGVVIAYDAFGSAGNLRTLFNKGRTATHEIGHWLGLIHTWGDSDCGDDFVDDTPTQESYNYGCPSFPKLSNCSPNSNGDMFMNFMDFSNDECMNIFTIGQVKRMRALFADKNIRNSFLTSTAGDSTLAQPVISAPVTVPLPPAAKPVATSIKVYPSPVQSVTTIECSTASTLTVKTVHIFNSLGMKVYTATLSQEKTMLNLSNLISGIYIVQIGDGKSNYTTKIIKE